MISLVIDCVHIFSSCPCALSKKDLCEIRLIILFYFAGNYGSKLAKMSQLQLFCNGTVWLHSGDNYPGQSLLRGSKREPNNRCV